MLGPNDAYWPAVASRLPDVTGATRASANIAAALADATRVAERAAQRAGGADTGGFTDPGTDDPVDTGGDLTQGDHRLPGEVSAAIPSGTG